MTARLVARWAATCLLLVFAHGVSRPASARPEYLAKFQADPYRRTDVDGCATCHVNPDGGGARNDFGTAFQATAHDMTPLLRASFPQQFTFDSVKLPDGSAFHFSDPQSKVVVFERQNQRVLVNLAEISAPKATVVPLPANRMSFFVTSKGFSSPSSVGGLAGADRHCQALAKAAGAGDREWRAYLSTSFKGAPAVNAGDRIGGGPWFNAKGARVARGPIDLHLDHRVVSDVVFTEKGESMDALKSMPSDSVVILTGSNADGSAAVDKNCGNWAMPTGEAVIAVASWNAERAISCGGTPSTPTTEARLYCFAVK